MTTEDILKTKEQRENIAFFLRMSLRGFKYKERPVGIREFILSPDFLNLKDTIRPKVLIDLEDLFDSPDNFGFCKYEEAVFDEGIGSGKTMKSAIIVAYLLYHLLCLKNPQKTFKMDSGSMITIMNVSVNAIQAKKVVFGEIRSRILNSPWFVTHVPDPNIRSELRFDGNICILPGHSGTTFPLGYNLVVAIMDEAAFYTETETHDVAEDMFYTLKRRIISRFGKHGLLVMISSPRYIDDFIEKKSREADDDEDIFSRRHAIWEVLPDDIIAIEAGACFELDGIKIPNKYKKDFQKNPEKAWRDLGARPSFALEPYFKQLTLIDNCIDDTLTRPFVTDTSQAHIPRFEPWFKGVPGRKYYMHVDLGLTHDAAGVCLGHPEKNIAVIDFMLRIKPTTNIEVDIDSIVNMIFELVARGFKFKKVTYDQWNSASSIQKLKKRNIKSEKCSVESLEAYDTFKEYAYMNLVRFYRDEFFLNEIRRMELIKGKRVDHPTGTGTKDLTDSVVGVVFNIVKDIINRRVITGKLL